MEATSEHHDHRAGPMAAPKNPPFFFFFFFRGFFRWRTGEHPHRPAVSKFERGAAKSVQRQAPLTTSTQDQQVPTSIGPFNRGRWMRLSTPNQEQPRLVADSSMLGGSRLQGRLQSLLGHCQKRRKPVTPRSEASEG